MHSSHGKNPKKSSKGSILKKTTELWPSRSYLLYSMFIPVMIMVAQSHAAALHCCLAMIAQTKLKKTTLPKNVQSPFFVNLSQGSTIDNLV